MRVVRGADHNTCFSVKRTRQVSDRWRRHRPQQHHISTCGGQAQPLAQTQTCNPEIRVSLPTRMRHAPMLRNAMPAAQPSLSMKSGVIGNSPTRPRMPSVPKYFFRHKCSIILIRLILQRQSCAPHRPSRRRHAHGKIRAPLVTASAAKRQAAGQPLAHRTVQRLAQSCSCADNTDQQRTTQRHAGTPCAGTGSGCVRRVLAKPKPGSRMILLGEQCLPRRRGPCARTRKPLHLAMEVVRYMRVVLHIARLAAAYASGRPANR